MESEEKSCWNCIYKEDWCSYCINYSHWKPLEVDNGTMDSRK